jgi:hypothetical protein
MTSAELKRQLDDHISRLVYMPSGLPATRSGCAIFITHRAYIKAKYSCTSEEEDFRFSKGLLTYKGFELKITWPINKNKT